MITGVGFAFDGGGDDARGGDGGVGGSNNDGDS